MAHHSRLLIGFLVQCTIVGSLESTGLIKELDSQIQNDKNLHKQWSERQHSYEAERTLEIDEKIEIHPYGGVGGARESIKCLHSHLADQLATRKNIVGKIVEELIGGFDCQEPCIDDEKIEKNKAWKVEW
jgi:hypothetical protein